MAFTESLKASVRRRSQFACCLCHDLGVEVHHIVPQREGGADSEDNAAPLCPTCHERYGANPEKRKFIREARDLWYDICAERFRSDSVQLEQIKDTLDGLATRSDIDSLLVRVQSLLLPGDEELPSGLGERALSPDALYEYLRWMYGSIPHCGPALLASLGADLKEVGYTDIRSLHSVLDVTRPAFADHAREERDAGRTLDVRTNDASVAILFLALWDERYCRIHYPKTYQTNVTERHPWPWRRPDSSGG